MRTTLTLQPPVWPSCPSWCTVCDPSRDHPAHYGLVAEWEGPGPVVGEVGIVQRGDGPLIIRVDVEEWGPAGETVAHTITDFTPAQALAEALRDATGEALAVALVAAACGLGDEEV